jgi:iron complex outermembrane recepter protein
MRFRNEPRVCALIIVFAMLVLFAGAPALHAQSRQLLNWHEDLNYLKDLSGEQLMSNQASVVQIRTGIDLWLKMHPYTKVELKAAPPEPWDAKELQNQVSLLSEAVEAIMKEDPTQPFELGVMTVSVTAETSPLSPVTATVDRREITNLQAVNAALALDYMPGVAIDHTTSNRNEASIRMRGFTTKGQVALYIDGIPVSMPYDGTIDFNRFLSSGIAELQASKGFSSPLLGPNAMAGSINLVTRQPEKKLQMDALLGTGSASTLLSSFNIGSRWKKFYFQGSMDWLQSDFVPLSGNFPLNNFQKTYERNNTDTRDASYSGRVAWTPKGEDQYVFSYTNQKGEKGVPLYAGPNSAATFGSSAYRRWPFWNKNSYYLITNTGLSESNSIKFRAYYDQFKNGFNFYDDATYSTMNRTTSNSSIYGDHSAGGSAEFTTRALRRNIISASFVFRDDVHKEELIYPARPPRPFVAPTITDRAQTFSMGFQDLVTITSRLKATLGFSADYLMGKQVVDNSDPAKPVPFKCTADPNNTSFSGCTSHVWNYNPQASISFAITSSDNIYATFADRGRFPLIKDSYSYRLGSAIANPDLKPEHNTSLNFGYSHAFPAKTVAQVEYFYNRLRDAIQSIYVKDTASPPKCPSNTGTQAGYCSQNVNVAREVHQGVEISVRSTPIPRLTMDVNYSYLNRTLVNDFGNISPSQVLTSVVILPTYPKNKVIANAALRLPREILAIASYRYEGGITLQDTTYRTAPQNLPFASSYGTVDIGGLVPLFGGMSVQAGVKNLFDRNYYYTAGYPEAGRNWYFNGRYKF